MPVLKTKKITRCRRKGIPGRTEGEKDREIELASKEENTKKLQAQLYQLKTNKEYNVMLQQIQDSKADASLVEDKILEAMDKIDKAKLNVDAEKRSFLRRKNSSMNKRQN